MADPARDALGAAAAPEPPPGSSPPGTGDGASAAGEAAAAEGAGEGEVGEAGGGGELKAEAADGEVRSADGEAADAEEPGLQAGAARKVKLELKERKEKKQKVDEDEIQKMQILVSSFSEEQLNRYEMYRRSAFPKAAIKRVRSPSPARPEQPQLKSLTQSRCPRGWEGPALMSPPVPVPVPAAADPVHHRHLGVPERRHRHVGHLQGVRRGGGGGSPGCV
ncbi:transcription initiation factor TFIID subunit 11 isoform 1-T1 [Ammospiza maritima maritima]